jgi:Zn-dependent metalloprotease
VRRDPRNDTVVLVRGDNLSRDLDDDPSFRAARASGDGAAMARQFIERYRDFFRLARPQEELRSHAVSGDELGFLHARLHQVHAGLPVWNAEIIVHLDADRRVYRVQGSYIPTPPALDLEPAVSDDQARQAVAKALNQDACVSCTVALGITARESPRLAYRVLTRPSIAEGWVVTVDARNGTVIDKVSTVMTGGFQLKDPDTRK